MKLIALLAACAGMALMAVLIIKEDKPVSKKDQQAALMMAVANHRSFLINQKSSLESDSPELKYSFSQTAKKELQWQATYQNFSGKDIPAKLYKLLPAPTDDKGLLNQAISSQEKILQAGQAAGKGAPDEQLKQSIKQNMVSARATLLNLRQQVAALYPDPRSDTALADYPKGNNGRSNLAIIRCGPSHLNNDDPIIHANMPGMSHRHQFFGNNLTNASNNFVRMSEATTSCLVKKDLSAYWVPTLIDQANHPVTPLRLLAYYGGTGGSKITEPFPAKLRMIAGDANALGWQNPEIAGWACNRNQLSQALPPSCPRNTLLRLRFPDCWDGKRLDSPDHRHHVSYSKGEACPSAHPHQLPQLRMDVYYPISSLTGPNGRLAYRLSSGPIWTIHGDFINLWPAQKMKKLVDQCIIGGRGCPKQFLRDPNA